MKYVALLSGGKDSCYNLLHCARNGHELIAAASLRPEQGKDEIDSYMYQTVGQDAIELVARALDVPLYRRIIRGTAINQGSEYGARDPLKKGGVSGDETEDLFELLSSTEHPDLQGVSVGAILSNYQRVRVEHVCRRLSLTPLCYLWQRDQGELLSEMIEAGLEAIVIKVAGIGLTPKHLGKSLGQLQPTLIKLHDLYDLHLCGEGGEYETLTIDCPLFKQKIQIDETETVIHSDNDFATVAYLRITNAHLVDKDLVDSTLPTIPPLLNDAHASVASKISLSQSSQNSQKPHQFDHPSEISPSSFRKGSWISVTNVQRADDGKDISLADEVKQCFDILADHLNRHSSSLSHCANINVYISSMEYFGAVNAVYSEHFGSGPPARACVAVDLPSPIRIRLDALAFAESNDSERQWLHVQGLSYWAPANIGPYSQAIIIKGQQVFISGQIGLIPASLTLPMPQSLATETALACQHVKRVICALKTQSGGGWEGHTQLALYWLTNQDDLLRIRSAIGNTESPNTPTLFVVVSSLPKGALVEKQVSVHTGRFIIEDEDGDLVNQASTPTYSQGTGDVKYSNSTIHWELTLFERTGLPSLLLCINGKCDPDQVLAELKNRLGTIEKILCSRVFYRCTFNQYALPSGLIEKISPITYIPCRFIATTKVDNWDYAICITCV
ncbi:Diphthine--ammonia ligase [Abortiporus biennis]